MVQNLTDDTFQDEVAQGVTVVDFYADWCSPCRMMAPVIEEASEEMEGQVTFAKVDIDKHRRVAGALKITSIPTLVVFKNGQEVSRSSGVKDLDALMDYVSEYL